MLTPEEDKEVEELLRSDDEETADRENVRVSFASKHKTYPKSCLASANKRKHEESGYFR